MRHYIVVTDVDTSEEAVTKVGLFLESMKDKYEDTEFKVLGTLDKQNRNWVPVKDVELKITENTILSEMEYILSTSPFGTTESDVTFALANRRRDYLKLAMQHMQWLYTTAGLTKDDLNIWVDSIFENELDGPGVTNITTEYESDSQTTYMVAIEVIE